jgi:adenine-specific DNA-methyltransferase
MILKELKPRKALNKAFLKVKPNRTEIEGFKTNLITLLDRTNDTESEEFHKNLVIDFLKKTYYDPNHFINTKGRNDLVIHNGQNANSTVGVILEAKKPTNKAEMISTKRLNTKAFQELVLYYLRERITHKNLEVKHLVATNINEWFIFDATLFDRLFAQNKNLVKQFNDFEGGRLADTKTDFFYKQIAEPFIDSITAEIEFTYFNIQDFQKPLRNTDKADDNSLIALFKLLSPEHLLKLPFTNDSNSLDKRFYSELLHIIGLTETKEGSKKLIERNKAGERHTGTILEDTIIQLDSLDKLSRLEKPNQFGNTQQERLFNVALELSITWINRILFLKLLEAQLITYHKGDKSFSFLHLDKIRNYDDLNSLFFQVLARKYDERNEDVKKAFEKTPYLNSSLFEPTDIEQVTLFISNLKDDKRIPIFSQTVLKDQQGKKRTGNISTLQYLFEFLDAYDFGAEGGEEIQEDNKTLINASVLGLIFEKINGYKDGSFFTPGFITMYMCRETIRKAVVQKFNEAKKWNCTTLKELYNKIEDRKEANQIVNSIKICDPAVGSGHFLVSALNEMIAVKNDLKILQDRDGKRLKEYQVEVVNDELVVTDEEGELFEYNPSNKESQRIQETLFHEKQTIIENCLFGVDINSNSVKICRLRLWIELLKNAYYIVQTGHALSPIELQTLPNIDINIKCGNSLVSRFAIDADLKQALKKSKWTIDSYRIAVDTYRNAESKEQKREMERLIADIKSDFRSEISKNDPKVVKLRKLNGELFKLTNQGQLFEMSKKEKADWNKKVKQLTEETKKLENEIEEIKANKIFENAFEWRFEFPEVLNDDGDFVGFDVVIGNPPYVFGGNEGISISEKNYYKDNYECGSDKINLFTLFIEKAFRNLKNSAQFAFIIPNTFLRVTSYDSTRRYLVNNSRITSIYDFGDRVFDDAVTTAIVITATKGNFADYQTKLINASSVGTISKQDIIDNHFVIATNTNKNSSSLLKKLKSNQTLGSICKEMIFGVVITKNKNEVVSDKPLKGWKPFLEGREIGAYTIQEIKQWLNYEPTLLHRARTKEVFETPEKILIQRITGGSKPLKAAYDNQGFYNKESINNIILNDDSPVQTKFVLALLNSKLINWFYVNQFTNESNLTVNLSKAYLSQIPLAIPNKTDEERIVSIVERILLKKKENKETIDLETKIDQLVYQLYGLTEEEIKIVEGK